MKTLRTLILPIVMLLLCLPAVTVLADSLEMYVPPQEIEIWEQEVFWESQNGYGQGYEFTVFNPATFPPIFSFGVRNDTLFNNPLPVALRPGWGATILTGAAWDGVNLDTSSGFDGFAFGGNSSTGGPVWRTDMFGSFEQLFGETTSVGGPQFAQVAFYFDDDETQQNAIGEGEVQGGFFADAEVAQSPWVALQLDSNAPGGFIVQQGHTIIPVPSALWMGLGLLSLLAARRKLRRRP
jgi:hypothetical protein